MCLGKGNAILTLFFIFLDCLTTCNSKLLPSHLLTYSYVHVLGLKISNYQKIFSDKIGLNLPPAPIPPSPEM